MGVYHFSYDRFSDPSYPWPIDFGAPVQSSGLRILYGDAMTWSAMQSDFTQTVPVLSDPIEGLRITQSVFGYQRSDLRNVLFVRYDLKNMGSSSLTDVLVGYYSDTDLANPFNNAVGYDADRGITYTPTPADGFTTYYAAGYAFVEIPILDPTHGASAHRVMWKEEHPLYGETNLVVPSQVLDALKGRDNNGAPMIDPTTGQETAYAFSGNPTTGTGWVDEMRDVCSLMAKGPFQLEAGDERAVTVVWAVEEAGSLEAALIRLKAKIDNVRLETRLWNF